MCIGVFVCMHTVLAALQVVNFSDRTGRFHLLGLERFADHTGREAWDYSAWVRVYSSYLDERVGAFRCAGPGQQAGFVCILPHISMYMHCGGVEGGAGVPARQSMCRAHQQKCQLAASGAVAEVLPQAAQTVVALQLTAALPHLHHPPSIACCAAQPHSRAQCSLAGTAGSVADTQQPCI